MTLSAQSKLAQVRHQVAIWGFVSDALTQAPIPAAEVVLVQMPPSLSQRLALKALQAGNQWQTLPERGDRIWAIPNRSVALVDSAAGDYTLQTQTATDGSFTFLDLPDGSYTVRAALPAAGTRYAAATSATLTVTCNQQHTISPARVELQMPPTALAGRVTAPDPQEQSIAALKNLAPNGAVTPAPPPAPKTIPIPMAKVQLQETGDYTYTNAAGEYCLTRLEASETKAWAIAVSAPGYELDAAESSINVKLQQGKVQTQDFSLKHKFAPLASTT